MPEPVRIRLFGGMRVWVGEREIDKFPSTASAALLALLALKQGKAGSLPER